MIELANFDNTYARLPERFYAKIPPSSVTAPQLIKLNTALANELGLEVTKLKLKEGVAVLSGNELAHGSEPLAMAYAGQQFGNWVPQLGDGRAVLLGEVVSLKHGRRDIQLKGSGPTPFSRMGDGRAWLGPVMREYIVSEAMEALGVPTTRALAMVTTGEDVVREAVLPGAILTRVAKSHLRVGTFQYFAARRDAEALKLLADYAIERLYPECKNSEQPYKDFLQSVVNAQAYLVAKWISLGFVHGVMNTDNVSIAGETIDYGPCAFMDDFHPDRVFSSIDEGGRYAFSNQPKIAHWNLVQFAQAILSLLGETQDEAVSSAQSVIDTFPSLYQEAWLDAFRGKLGLKEIEDGDEVLINDLLKAMASEGADFTRTFRALASDDLADLNRQFVYRTDIDDWATAWKLRSSRETQNEQERIEMMKAHNPAFIPRNHLIEQCIKAGMQEDYSVMERLISALENPFADQPENANLMLPPQPEEQVRYTFCGT